jgi:hypothetical protein
LISLNKIHFFSIQEKSISPSPHSHVCSRDVDLTSVLAEMLIKFSHDVSNISSRFNEDLSVELQSFDELDRKYSVSNLRNGSFVVFIIVKGLDSAVAQRDLERKRKEGDLQLSKILSHLVPVSFGFIVVLFVFDHINIEAPHHHK